MKVLIGVDPHKASVAVAAIDEARGELVERARFPQNLEKARGPSNAGLSGSRASLGRGERQRAWGRHLAVRLAAAGESVVDVPPKLSARVRVLSSGNARKRTMGSMPSPPRSGRLAQREAGSRRSRDRLRGTAPAFSERREDLVAERTRALNRLHGLLRDLVPGGVAGARSRPTGRRASCAAYGPRAAPRPVCAGGWLRRCCVTSERSTERSLTWMGA